MQCRDAREVVSAFIDDELAGEAQRLAVAHLEGCPACKKLADDYRSIRAQVASGYTNPPSDLADKIRKRIAAEEADAWRSRSKPRMLQAAALLLACGLSALASWYLTERAESRDRLERDILSSHVRSLMQDKPVQIASSERHAVKPWFGGKVDFSPTVKDLTAQGFPLVGARVDYVGERRVAALVYMRRLHVINVFIWPSRGDGQGQPQVVALKGYHGIVWTADGMTNWAVSDLNLPELKELQALLH